MTSAERQRQRGYVARRRAKAKSAGICIACCKLTAAPGRVRCEECLAKCIESVMRSPSYERQQASARRRNRIEQPSTDWNDCCASHGRHRSGCNESTAATAAEGRDAA